MNLKYQNKNDEFFKISASQAVASDTGGSFDNDLNNNLSSVTDQREQEFHDFVRDIIVSIYSDNL